MMLIKEVLGKRPSENYILASDYGGILLQLPDASTAIPNVQSSVGYCIENQTSTSVHSTA